MAQLDLSGAQSLMAKTKYTVYGYIREIEQKLSISIPSGLIALFVLFYGDQIDKWDNEFVGEYLKLSDDDRTVTNTENRLGGNVFGTMICETGFYEWKFQISNHTDNDKVGEILIGIWRIQNDVTPPTDTYFTQGQEQGYAYYLKVV